MNISEIIKSNKEKHILAHSKLDKTKTMYTSKFSGGAIGTLSMIIQHGLDCGFVADRYQEYCEAFFLENGFDVPMKPLGQVFWINENIFNWIKDPVPSQEWINFNII